MSWVSGKKNPCGALSLLPTLPAPLSPLTYPRPTVPLSLHIASYVFAFCYLCFALPFLSLSSSMSSLSLSSFVLLVFGYVFLFCLSFLFLSLFLPLTFTFYVVFVKLCLAILSLTVAQRRAKIAAVKKGSPHYPNLLSHNTSRSDVVLVA